MKRRLRISSIIMLAGLAAAAAAQAGQTAAPTVVIEVNSTADNLAAGDGDCTLREAINNANANADTTAGDCAAGSAADLIQVPAGTITLAILGPGEDGNATGDLDILDSVIVSGAGSAQTVIEAGINPAAGIDRVFHLIGALAVSFEGVTIRHGNTVENGGGLLIAGGTVSLVGCQVNDNIASHGGGIVVEAGSLDLMQATLRANSATNQGGAMFSTGFSAVTLNQSAVSLNSAPSDGGGLFNEDGDMTVINSTVNNNTAGNSGGGILSAGDLAIAASTVNNNAAGDSGGGIVSEGELLLSNSTISGNVAAVDGGGLALGGAATLINSTLTLNTAIGSGGGLFTAGIVGPTNTIVADNGAGGDCFVGPGGAIVSGGHNLDGDGTCAWAAAGDISPGNAFLGPLQNNGGFTPTHALLDGSEAIDAADDGACAAPPVDGIDQRGVARPQDGDGDGTAVCDMGAYELAAVQSFALYLPAIKQP